MNPLFFLLFIAKRRMKKMLTRRPYYACLPRILLRFGVIFYLLLIANISHAIHDGSLLDFNFPKVVSIGAISGAISGRITDSNGDPISSLEVVAHAAGVNRTEILGVSTTDVNGNYTIGRVRAGRGYVSIKLGEVIIWYDGQEGTEDPIRAREVHITAGQTNISINIGVTKKAMPWIPLLLLLDSSSPLLGTWTGSAGFGELSFIVNATGTGITEITYTWIDFSCGGFVRNGSIRVTRTSPWPITNNQFIIENTFGPNFEVTLNGTFNQTGTNVSGNWEAVSNGTTCSGTWNASPVQ
jgi:hypothetical protein